MHRWIFFGRKGEGAVCFLYLFLDCFRLFLECIRLCSYVPLFGALFPCCAPRFVLCGIVSTALPLSTPHLLFQKCAFLSRFSLPNRLVFDVLSINHIFSLDSLEYPQVAPLNSLSSTCYTASRCSTRGKLSIIHRISHIFAFFFARKLCDNRLNYRFRFVQYGCSAWKCSHLTIWCTCRMRKVKSSLLLMERLWWCWFARCSFLWLFVHCLFVCVLCFCFVWARVCLAHKNIKNEKNSISIATLACSLSQKNRKKMQNLQNKNKKIK